MDTPVPEYITRNTLCKKISGMHMMLSKHVPFEVSFPKGPVITHTTVILRIFSALEAYVIGQ